MSLAERLRPTAPTHRWVGVGAAALGWLVLYEINLPLWDWVVYDLAGLSPASRAPGRASRIRSWASWASA